MGSIWIREFKGGLDMRRLPETSAGGTLIRATNCHINRGGEIEQRAVFQHIHTQQPNRTVGLVGVSGQGLFVFGHTPSPPDNHPGFLTYQYCPHPAGKVPNYMRHATVYNSRPAVVLNYADGNERFVFHDGVPTDEKSPPRLAGARPPNCVFTWKSKLLIGAGPAVFYSGIRTPTLFDTENEDTGAGAGFTDFGFEISGPRILYSMGAYDDALAYFFEDTILIWTVDVDLAPAATFQRQIIPDTGTTSPMSVCGFAGGDLIFLHSSGIRSLRARDSSRYATTTDIGSAIDALVQPIVDAAPPTVLRRACAVVEPTTGALWLAIGTRIFVLSYHAASKVSAWSVYEPGFRVDAMTVYNRRVYLRSLDDIYVYGSVEGPHAYSDEVIAEAWLPYLDADRPSQVKTADGIDVAVRGEWEVRIGTDPNNHNASDRIGVLDFTTYGRERIPYSGEFNHMSLRFRSRRARSATEPAIVSSALVHHDLDDLED